MAGDLTAKYGNSNQTITITITGLATNSMRGSTAISNASSLNEDALVQVQVRTTTSTNSLGYVNVYAYATSATNTYPGGFNGVDGAYTGLAANLTPIGRLSAVANNSTYTSNVLSVAAAFGGTLPQSWGIVVENQSGSTLDANTGSAWFQGSYGAYT